MSEISCIWDGAKRMSPTDRCHEDELAFTEFAFKPTCELIVRKRKKQKEELTSVPKTYSGLLLLFVKFRKHKN